MSFILATTLGLHSDDVKTVGAAATAVGVLVALFRPGWQRWWRAPLLSVGYEAKQGDPHWDHVAIADKAFFLRIRVRNARGCVAAKDVEVIVTAFRSDEIGLDERSLEWSAKRARKRDPVTKLDIAPGLRRHVDVAQRGPMADGEVVRARLCVFPKPWASLTSSVRVRCTNSDWW